MRTHKVYGYGWSITRIPIQVLTSDLGTGDHEVGINYDVVVVPGLVDTPPPTTKPRGYSSEVGSRAVINPGRSLVFSIPRDHVSKWWYIQARFDLVLPTPRAGTQPFSTVSFYWEGIPPKYRAVARKHIHFQDQPDVFPTGIERKAGVRSSGWRSGRFIPTLAAETLQHVGQGRRTRRLSASWAALYSTRPSVRTLVQSGLKRFQTAAGTQPAC